MPREPSARGEKAGSDVPEVVTGGESRGRTGRTITAIVQGDAFVLGAA